MKHTTDITRLNDKNTEAQRKLDIALGSESALKTQLKSAEATIRGLKEEVARTKALVNQTRTSCATEVRRRDRQIDTLKKQVTEAGRARGSRSNPAITTITVTGDTTGTLTSESSPTSDDLQPQTNEFLTELASKLSAENDAVLMVMQRAMEQLQEMSGWQRSEKTDAQVKKHPGLEDLTFDLDSVMDHMKMLLTNPSFVPLEEVTLRDDEITRLKDGWVKMESRWNEAVHLIDGWRKRMSTNGRPLSEEDFQMGLRLSPVRVKNVRETKSAGSFGLESVSEDVEEVDAPPSPCPSSQGSVHLVPAPIEELDESDSESSGLDEDEPLEYQREMQAEAEAEEPHVAVEDDSRDSSPLPEPPQLSPLKNSKSAGNRGTTGIKKPALRQTSIPSASDERPRRTLTAPTASSTIRSRVARPTSRIPSQTSAKSETSAVARPQQKATTAESSNSRPSTTESKQPEAKEVLKSKIEPKAEPRPASKTGDTGKPEQHPTKSTTLKRSAVSRQLARPEEPAPQQSPLTMSNIAAKLAATEREADAARVRAKLKAARLRKSSQTVPAAAQEEERIKQDDEDRRDSNIENVDPVKQYAPAEGSELKRTKRKREQKQSMRASRRRSTLSPWELETLMAGNA